MDYVAWIRQLDQGFQRRNFLVLVEELYLWDLMKQVIKSSLVPNFQEFNYQSYDFSLLDQDIFHTAVETLPMMADKKVLIFENLPLKREELKKNEEMLELLASYLKDPNPSIYIFLSFFGKKPFRGKIFKEMEKELDQVELFRLDRRKLSSFIEKKFLDQKLQWDQRLVPMLVDYSRYLEKDQLTNLYDMDNLLKKLISSAEGGVLKEERIKKLLAETFDDNIFSFLDAISQRNNRRALFLLKGYQIESRDPFQIFYMLVRQVRNLLAIKAGLQGKLRDEDIRKRMNLSSFEYSKLRSHMGNFALEELVYGHRELFEMEKKIKSQPYDLYFGLERFVVCFCGGLFDGI